MIIVKLMGGLGNQMFQYALGRRAALRHGTELKLDHSFLESRNTINTPRDYELHHFHVQCELANEVDCKFVAMHGTGWLKRILLANQPLEKQMKRSDRVINERSFRFDPSIETLPDNVYLNGFWQSEQYFRVISDELRQEFTPIAPLVEMNLQIASSIKDCQSVSLHVRRCDYVTDQHTAAFHGTCDLKYYMQAVNMIAQKVSAPHFFIFSDDIAWAKTNLQIHHPVTIVEQNSPQYGFEDLRLMTLCRHHIIANSSFSWWGAWLNSVPHKIVIAPQRWFKDPAIDTSDLVPAEWIRI